MADRRTPPPSIWARALEEVNAETRAQAELEGWKLSEVGMPLAHIGHAHPWAWKVLVSAIEKLRDKSSRAGDNEDHAATALDRMLRQSAASEELAGALVTYERGAADPVARRREETWKDDRRIAPAVRIREARRRIAKMQDDLFLGTEKDPIPLGEGLRLSSMDIERHDGAPRAEEVGAAVRALSDALLRLDRLAVQMARAAPPPKARPHSVEVRARTKMFETMCRAYVAAEGWGPDDTFWEMVRAIWEAYSGDREIPGLRDLKKKISKKF